MVMVICQFVYMCKAKLLPYSRSVLWTSLARTQTHCKRLPHACWRADTSLLVTLVSHSISGQDLSPTASLSRLDNNYEFNVRTRACVCVSRCVCVCRRACARTCLDVHVHLLLVHYITIGLSIFSDCALPCQDHA
eukprot:scpid21132/ scgid30514/ 